MQPSSSSSLAKDAAQQTAKYTHEEVQVTLYKDHDQEHPLVLTLRLVLSGAETKVYATHSSSTVVCNGKEEWFNAIEPNCVAIAKAIDNEAADAAGKAPVSGTESAIELDLKLDFAKRMSPNTKFEDEAEIWDPNALLHLILDNIKAGECDVRRGFFKNADLRELDSCYRAVVARNTIVDSGPQIVEEAKGLPHLDILYAVEQKEEAGTGEKKDECEVTMQEDTGKASGAAN